MERAIQGLMQADFRKAIWLAPLALGVHEAEEWDIGAFESTHFADPGHFALADHPVLWIGLAMVTAYGVIWTALTAWPKNPKFAAFLTLPFFVYLAFGNVLQHIYWTFFFRTYAPGVVTAVLLVAPIVIALTFKAIRDKLIPWWYGAVLYLLIVPTMVSTIHAANRDPPQLPPQIVAGQKNGIDFARWVLGRHD